MMSSRAVTIINAGEVNRRTGNQTVAVLLGVPLRKAENLHDTKC
jgi:hypothetical protein